MHQVLRMEKKYLLTLEEAKRYIGRVRHVMHADKHNGDNGYMIRSLYFDTLVDGDYFDKVEGLEIRRKIRLRIYDPKSSFAMLEMKQKQGENQLKRSLRVSREDGAALCRGDYSPLLKYSEDFAAEVFGVLNGRCYRPKSVVEYRRMAFTAKENSIRVTFDSDIRANEANFDIFADNLCMNPVFDPSHVALEVKYNGFLLSYIKQLIDLTDRREMAIGKYSQGRMIAYGGEF